MAISAIIVRIEKHWMLGLVTSDEGIPLWLTPLDGNASGKASFLHMVLELTHQLCTRVERPPGSMWPTAGSILRRIMAHLWSDCLRF